MTLERSWTARARAKVNLRLQILAREITGYHQIETVFQALELADRIRLILRDDGEVTLKTMGRDPEDLGPPDWNLAVQAARRFAEAYSAAGERFPGVDIRLEKHIPAGAGLGGGSSDAATVLRGLNTLCDAGFAASELVLLGSELGADVSFFSSGALRALAWGRGDRVLSLDPLPARSVLLAVPSEPIETAWAYGVLAEHRDRQSSPVPTAGLLGGDVTGGWEEVAARARNDFEPAVFPVRSELSRIKKSLVNAGARPALLSGSGSALFGVFAGEGELERAAAQLRDAEPALELIATRTAEPSSDD